MKHKNTLKRNKCFRRHTRKKLAYGGMLRASAAEWKPLVPQVSKSVEPSPEMIKIIRDIGRIMNNHVVAIDCEMVGVAPDNTNALAHVAIVDFYGNEIYNKYVIPSGGIDSITHERTEYSGITKKLLRQKETSEDALPFNRVKVEVHELLKNKTIVGHGLISDFKVLDYTQDMNDVWDTAILAAYMKNNPDNQYLPEASRRKQAKKLKLLSMEISGNNIQKIAINVNGRPKPTGHSPLEDARASMNLYRISYGFPKAVYDNMAKNKNPR